MPSPGSSQRSPSRWWWHSQAASSMRRACAHSRASDCSSSAPESSEARSEISDGRAWPAPSRCGSGSPISSSCPCSAPGSPTTSSAPSRALAALPSRSLTAQRFSPMSCSVGSLQKSSSRRQRPVGSLSGWTPLRRTSRMRPRMRSASSLRCCEWERSRSSRRRSSAMCGSCGSRHSCFSSPHSPRSWPSGSRTRPGCGRRFPRAFRLSPSCSSSAGRSRPPS